MGIGDVYSICLYVAKALVRINAWCVFALPKLNGLEFGPWRILWGQVFTRWLCGKAEDAAGTSEDMYLHMLLHYL
jgi:hypothetical protein